MFLNKRFLIIQLRQIGDVVLTTPLAHILKEAFPGCHVAFLTEALSAPLLENNPEIDQLIVTERKGGLFRKMGLVAQLRSAGFDVAIDSHCIPTSALFTLFSGAKRKIGFITGPRDIAYTDKVARTQGYVVEVKKKLLEPLGVKSDWLRPLIFLTEEERAWGEAVRHELLARAGAKRLLTVDASHKALARRWPVEHYAGLLKMMSARYDCLPVALWGPGEREVAETLFKLTGGLVSVSPETTLRKLAALLASADFHIGNCSAPRHIAVAVGTPTFAFLGSSYFSWTFPSPEHGHDDHRLPCWPCGGKCDNNAKCLAGRTPEDVWPLVAAWADGLFVDKNGGRAS